MTNEELRRSAEALLDLDARGALVPHGIGGLARQIITDLLDALAAAEAMEAKAMWALRAIEDGEGYADEIARQTLAELTDPL